MYVNTQQTTESANWLMSIFTGQPSLGWHDTLAFLSLPAILFVSQTLSTKVLTPTRDPSKPMTEQEEISQGILKNLPLIVAVFSVNVPAGLGVYWIVNNILTTLTTITLKARFANTPLPRAVVELMEQVDSNSVQIPTNMQNIQSAMEEAQPRDQSASRMDLSKVIDVEVLDPDKEQLTKQERSKEEELIAEMKRMNSLASEILKKKKDKESSQG